jgi:hypothetical protein
MARLALASCRSRSLSARFSKGSLDIDPQAAKAMTKGVNTNKRFIIIFL